MNSQVVKVYERLGRFCVTPNQLIALHIAFELRMTPQERDELLTHLKNLDEAREAVFPRWLGLNIRTRLLKMVSDSPLSAEKEIAKAKFLWRKRLEANRFSGRRSGAVWCRQRIRPGVTRYYRADTKSKSLTISFTGAARRMMMAIPDYLDEVAGCESDVLVIAVNPEDGYGAGVKGLGPNLERSLIELSEISVQWTYATLYCVGVSGGVMPALLSSFFLEFESVLLVGPPDRGVEEWKSTLLKRLREKGVPRETRFIVAYGQESSDGNAANFLAGELGAKIIVVPGVGHVAMPGLVRMVSLSELVAGRRI